MYLLRLALIGLLGGFLLAKAQPVEEWWKSYDSRHEDVAKGIAVDETGNIYITGYSMVPDNDYDFLTLAYDEWGDPILPEPLTYNSGSEDKACAITVDRKGNLYIAGTVTPTFQNFCVYKYNPKMDSTLWMRFFNTGDNDILTDLALDKEGNVYLSGYTYQEGNWDYLIVEFDSNGAQVWDTTYDRGDDDKATGIAVDEEGNIYVTGYCSNGANYDCVTIKYYPSGDNAWISKYNDGYNEVTNDIAVDKNGNVYITGYQIKEGYDYLTIKYYPDGDFAWKELYESGGDDKAYGIAVDKYGFVYVTGSAKSKTASQDRTVKYSPSGEKEWAVNSSSSEDKVGYGIAIDDKGYIYVAGSSFNEKDEDYYTVKYRQPIAVETEVSVLKDRWVKTYPNPFSSKTEIRYEPTSSERVSLEIYDSSGRLIKILSKKRRFIWDGTCQKGKKVQPGVYFYLLKTSSFSKTGKLILMDP